MSVTCKALMMALCFIAPLFQNSQSGQTSSPGAKLEIRLAEDKPASGLIKAKSADQKRTIYLHQAALVTNQDIVAASVRKHAIPDFLLEDMKAAGVKMDSDVNELFEIQVRFTEAAGARIAKATEKHIGKPLAILVDGKVISDGIVASRIDEEAVIVKGNLGFRKEEAQRIARALNRN